MKVLTYRYNAKLYKHEHADEGLGLPLRAVDSIMTAINRLGV